MDWRHGGGAASTGLSVPSSESPAPDRGFWPARTHSPPREVAGRVCPGWPLTSARAGWGLPLAGLLDSLANVQDMGPSSPWKPGHYPGDTTFLPVGHPVQTPSLTSRTHLLLQEALQQLPHGPSLCSQGSGCVSLHTGAGHPCRARAVAEGQLRPKLSLRCSAGILSPYPPAPVPGCPRASVSS